MNFKIQWGQCRVLAVGSICFAGMCACSNQIVGSENQVLERSAQSEEMVIPLSCREQADKIVQSVNGQFGVAVEWNGKLLYEHLGQNDFAMQSVVKFPLAMKVLDMVDKGELRLDSYIELKPEEMNPDTWSPMRKIYPQGGRFKVSELIRYAVAESDNNACDRLFRLIGGPKELEVFLRNRGFNQIYVCSTEEEMNQNPQLQVKNSSTPLEMNRLLREWNAGRILSHESTAFLRNVMSSTQTGKMRMRGQLPTHVVVAHKTGSGGRTSTGIMRALNDVGIVYLPNGEILTISLFVSNSPDKESQLEAAMAQLTRLFYNQVIELGATS